MKNRTALLTATFLVGFAVFAIMHWVFRFTKIESVMFGIIAATAEATVNYFKRLFVREKKNVQHKQDQSA